MNEKLSQLLERVQQTALRTGGAAAGAACGVGKKTGALASAARARVRSASLERQAESCFSQVGRMLYATHTGTPTDSEELLAKLQEIDALYAKIHEMDHAAGHKDAPRRCAVCGGAIREGDQFCRECGGKL